MEISRSIADKINGRLLALGVTRKQFAMMMEVQPSCVTKWLSGDHNFTIATLQQIQDVLMVNFFFYSEGTYNSCFPCIVDKPLINGI